jgi:hypothetical protein
MNDTSSKVPVTTGGAIRRREFAEAVEAIWQALVVNMLGIGFIAGAIYLLRHVPVTVTIGG